MPHGGKDLELGVGHVVEEQLADVREMLAVGAPERLPAARGDAGHVLQRGATVAVPSRSALRLRALREHLDQHLGPDQLTRLHLCVGDVTDERTAVTLRRRITDQVGALDAVVASVGGFLTAPSLLATPRGQLQQALGSSVVAHHAIAQTFLPALWDGGGTYLMMQGPLAFQPYPGLGTDLVSIGTAAQHMLFRALSQELAGGRARIVELVIHTLIRDQQTQPGSPLPAEAVGSYVADLFADTGDGLHGQSIQLRSPDQLSTVGLSRTGG